MRALAGAGGVLATGFSLRVENFYCLGMVKEINGHDVKKRKVCALVWL